MIIGPNSTTWTHTRHMRKLAEIGNSVIAGYEYRFVATVRQLQN